MYQALMGKEVQGIRSKFDIVNQAEWGSAGQSLEIVSELRGCDGGDWTRTHEPLDHYLRVDAER
jgi:hypothetical protein